MGPQLTAVLYTPLQIAIGVYLMYYYIGASFAAGIATMLALIALTFHLAKRIGKINKATNEAKDKRTKATQ
jgi:cytochrome c biogenesis protein CcdA